MAKKNDSYISAKESKKITRFNRQLTSRLEKKRANAAADGKRPQRILSER